MYFSAQMSIKNLFEFWNSLTSYEVNRDESYYATLFIFCLYTSIYSLWWVSAPAKPFGLGFYPGRPWISKDMWLYHVSFKLQTLFSPLLEMNWNFKVQYLVKASCDEKCILVKGHNITHITELNISRQTSFSSWTLK